MILPKNRIFIKVFKTIFISIIFFTTIFAIYSISSQKEEILKSLSLEAKSIANTLVYVSSDAIVLDDGSFLVEFNHEFLLSNDSVESIIISKNEKNHYIIKKDSWSFEEDIDSTFRKQERKEAFSQMIYSPILKKEVFHYVHPIEFSGTSWGHLHLSLSLDKYDKKIKNMYFSFISFFVVLIFVTIFISYLIARNFSKPIVNLNRVANRISKGNLRLRSRYKGNDEIGELSNTFNQMISTIQSSQKELEDSHIKLEERVNERTLELHEANKELENKTSQLEELNKNLDSKVKEEVEMRTKQETLLVQQSRLAAMGEMMGNIAHQWRQPLSAITTAASGIKVEKEFGMSEEDKEIERLGFIVNTSNYLSKTIDDFSNFFKPNKLKEEFLIEKKVEDSLSLVGASLKFHYIEIEKEFSSKQKVYGFSNEYAQAVMNILSNAKDVLQERNIEEPKIKIRIFSQNEYGILEVEDNAGGIEEDIISRVFDPYFTTKHKSQGTGIGLYMSKMIIEENMNGKLEVRNGKAGAIFKISMPMLVIKDDEDN